MLPYDKTSDTNNDNSAKLAYSRTPPINMLGSLSRTLNSIKQTLDSKGWEFSCPYNFIGSLPESLTQGLLVGQLLVGGLGVYVFISCMVMVICISLLLLSFSLLLLLLLLLVVVVVLHT